MKTIEYGAFSGIQFNNNIVWPSRLEMIGGGAFGGCNFRGGIGAFPEGLWIIGAGAFEGAQNMPKILNLPLSLLRVESSSFSNTDIQEVNLKGNLESIGSKAFANCENLTRVEIGKFVDYIGSMAFGG